MLRMHLDIIPFGLDHLTEQLTEIDIVNTRTGNLEEGNYVAKISEFNERNWLNDDEFKIGEVKIKGHKRKEGALKLLYLILKKYYEGY